MRARVHTHTLWTKATSHTPGLKMFIKVTHVHRLCNDLIFVQNNFIAHIELEQKSKLHLGTMNNCQSW